MHLDLQDLLNMRVDLVTDKELLPFARKSAEQDKNVFPFYFTVFFVDGRPSCRIHFLKKSPHS